MLTISLHRRASGRRRSRGDGASNGARTRAAPFANGERHEQACVARLYTDIVIHVVAYASSGLAVPRHAAPNDALFASDFPDGAPVEV